MLYVAGLPDISQIPESQRYEYIVKIYDAYKGMKTEEQRRKLVAEVLGKQPVPVDVKFMGLWDTIEALGVPDYEENWRDPNLRYGDQLCNVEKAAHAVSIDDSRARIFTPILLTTDNLTRTCPWVDTDNVVDEVWFAGAHSDVGGGYADTNISGISLNWMINQIEDYNLTPDNARVYADPFDLTHDSEAGLWGLIYQAKSRDLYAYSQHSRYNKNKLKVHRSVFERLSSVMPKAFEFQWQAETGFKHCFAPSKNERGMDYLPSSQCFDVVD
ncbi:hypothetical protein CS022_02100 [Veronia nyctiphanis]|uniref:T6SS Phospholipase effector Tle1-like catalytic domain-containing protein n=1 Tax=Veronia nyctiphanis TaxID=1278244 RepID=A0A4Q0YT47_9GAMM|nr:hypothetical protein CS022_02100 [Veronia nyctiphanis]